MNVAGVGFRGVGFRLKIDAIGNHAIWASEAPLALAP